MTQASLDARAKAEIEFFGSFFEGWDRTLSHRFYFLPNLRRLLVAINPTPDTNLIDLGCGVGYLLTEASARITEGVLAGIDITPAVIEAARADPKLRRADLRVCDIRAGLPWPDNSFDVATATSTFHHWGDTETLKEVWRILRPGGKFYIVDWCVPKLLTPLLDWIMIRWSGCWINGGYCSKKELHQLVESVGFKVTHSGLMPPMLLTVGEKQ